MTYEEAVAEICEATGITEFRFLKTRDKESLIERYYRKYPDELGEMWFKNVGELRGNADQIRNAYMPARSSCRNSVIVAR